MNLPVGKLKHDFLKKLFPTFNSSTSVVVGPQVGEDAAVIALGDNYLVATSDPITFATEDIGWYVVCVNSNDIAAMGAVPKWLLVTLLLPEDATTPAMVRDIMAQITQACETFGIALCGGHTEVTPAVTQPVVIGQMMGIAAKDSLLTSSDARIGDDLILTKGLGIEATAIIARECEKQVREKCDAQFLEQAKNYLVDPGISVLKDAQIAIATGGVHAMHDVTEGGIATAAYELATAAELGVVVYSDKLLGSPILYGDITRALCDMFRLNPLGVISSGAMLIASAPEKGNAICQALSKAGIRADIIGKFLPSAHGLWLEDATNTRQPLPVFETDEIAKLFSSSP
ncbi:hydrogenase expression/formation protein [Candidatus Poribacteria bacterium]|nr:hydrogenase expression/formation protein [Candidatus Poribacteria bacterium]MYB02435.1 hydrogenase expression/formation protein [Candidatus Poribacteria bacterium]